MGYRSCVAYMVIFENPEDRTEFLGEVDTTLIGLDLDVDPGDDAPLDAIRVHSALDVDWAR